MYYTAAYFLFAVTVPAAYSSFAGTVRRYVHITSSYLYTTTWAVQKPGGWVLRQYICLYKYICIYSKYFWFWKFNLNMVCFFNICMLKCWYTAVFLNFNILRRNVNEPGFTGFLMSSQRPVELLFYRLIFFYYSNTIKLWIAFFVAWGFFHFMVVSQFSWEGGYKLAKITKHRL